MKSKILMVMSVLLFATLVISGCSFLDEKKNPASSENADNIEKIVPADFGNQVDILNVEPIDREAYIGLTADSINALGRIAYHEFLTRNEGNIPQLFKTAGMCIELYVPFYSQKDQNWSGNLLGYNTSYQYTIGNVGCHLVCVSMLYAKWGYHPVMNPPGLNSWSRNGQAHYAFYQGSGNIYPYQALQYPNICRNWHWINSNQIISELQAGHPVIAHTNQYQYGSHFVVIYGWDGYRYWVKDPVKDAQNQNQPLSGTVLDLRVYGW